MIYFLKNPATKSFKIGYSRSAVKERRGACNTGNEFDLRILGSIQGTLKQEKLIHKRLKKHRIHPRREWFRGHPDVVKAVREMLAGDTSYLAPLVISAPLVQAKPKAPESACFGEFKSGSVVEHPAYGFGRILFIEAFEKGRIIGCDAGHLADIYFLRYGNIGMILEAAITASKIKLRSDVPWEDVLRQEQSSRGVPVCPCNTLV